MTPNARDERRQPAHAIATLASRPSRSRGYTPSVEAAAIDLFRRNGRKINSFEAADVDTQHILSRARASEWKDPTSGAKVILRDHRAIDTVTGLQSVLRVESNSAAPY